MEWEDLERLTALRGLEILDTAPEEDFDDLVYAAAHVCGTPMAAVSLVDEHRQWFKARIGLPVAETPRSDAFCAHTIRQRDVLEVPDATADPRFADNPLVRGELGLRFYAAAPLVTPDDFGIGTLCVLDQRPRSLGVEQRKVLQALANQAMAQIMLRQKIRAAQRLEERFRAVVDQSSDLVALVDADGGFRYVSPSVRTILGYRPDDPALRSLEAVIVDSDTRAVLRDVVTVPPGEMRPPFEASVRRRDGTLARLEVCASNLLHDPAVEAVVLTCRDVTHQREAEEALERTREHAALVLETANDAYIEIDGAGVVVEWNRQASATFGWQRAEAVGRRLADLIIPPQYREAHEGGVARAARSLDRLGETIFRGLEVVALRRDGASLPVEVTLWSIPPVGGEARFSAFVRDITERRALEEQLAHRALHDDLTGLPNRHLLRDRMLTSLGRARRDRGLVAVLFCDLDNFKVINDSTGHTVGDDVLRETARRLQSAVRPADTVVRFGGDEFVVVADNVASELDASLLAERIRAALAQPVTLGELEVPSSVSVGVATSDGNADAEQLLSDADAAMYLAKERGRDRVELFDDEIRARLLARLADERALRHAIDHGELRLVYQPIVSLPDHTVVGAEALVRWKRPGHGLLPPSRFIAVAEESGLVVPLGRWVLDEACAQARACRDARPGTPFEMSVNVSARQLRGDELAEVVASALDRAGLDASVLTLELTETALMEDLSQSTSILLRLQRAGVRIAIDDFGTGYSSLAYLKALPINTLKIDKTFVVNLATDPYDSAIVGAIATIGRSFGLHVVAEGVETAEQFARVEALGCGRAQGYYFARPMTAADLVKVVGATLGR